MSFVHVSAPMPLLGLGTDQVCEEGSHNRPQEWARQRLLEDCRKGGGVQKPEVGRLSSQVPLQPPPHRLKLYGCTALVQCDGSSIRRSTWGSLTGQRGKDNTVLLFGRHGSCLVTGNQVQIQFEAGKQKDTQSACQFGTGTRRQFAVYNKQVPTGLPGPKL